MSVPRTVALLGGSFDPPHIGHVLMALGGLLYGAAASLPLAPDLFLVGDRGALVAAERHHALHWTDTMIAHPAQAVSLVTGLTDALFAMLAEAKRDSLWAELQTVGFIGWRIRVLDAPPEHRILKKPVTDANYTADPQMGRSPKLWAMYYLVMR